MPAVALPGAYWEDDQLVVTEPVLGPEECKGSVCWRPVTGSRPREVREGDALCVDAPGARLTLVPAAEADDRLAAAEAARAFEGLRDAGALERWLAADPRPARAAFLLEELVPRAVDGAAGPAEFERLRRAAFAAAGDEAPRLKRAERAAFARARAAAREELAGCAEDAADAASQGVLDRLTSRATAQAGRVAATARLLGVADGGRRRRRRQRPRPPAPRKAGRQDRCCAAPPRRPPAPDLAVHRLGLHRARRRTGWRRGRWSARPATRRWACAASPNASRAKILDAAASPWPRLSRPRWSRAEDAPRPRPTPRPSATRARRSGPRPGRRALRRAPAREAAAPVTRAARARLRVEKTDAVGLAFSRDPGTGRRGRILVEAGGDRYVLDRRSGRQAAPARLSAADGKPALDAARLARVARLARALDAWKGAGVEASFTFTGGKLMLQSARALEAPRPVTPLLDPFSPRPAAETLNVRPVR